MEEKKNCKYSRKSFYIIENTLIKVEALFISTKSSIKTAISYIFHEASTQIEDFEKAAVIYFSLHLRNVKSSQFQRYEHQKEMNAL